MGLWNFQRNFEIPFNKDLVHQALVRQLANNRAPIAFAKTKGE